MAYVCLSDLRRKEKFLPWIYLSEQVEFLDTSRELHPYVFRKPVLCLQSLPKLFCIVSSVKKNTPMLLFYWLTSLLISAVTFGIPVNTIRQRSVNVGGMTLLSLKGPACKIVLWPVFGNLAFLTFPNGYGAFPNWMGGTLYLDTANNFCRNLLFSWEAGIWRYIQAVFMTSLQSKPWVLSS